MVANESLVPWLVTLSYIITCPKYRTSYHNVVHVQVIRCLQNLRKYTCVLISSRKSATVSETSGHVITSTSSFLSGGTANLTPLSLHQYKNDPSAQHSDSWWSCEAEITLQEVQKRKKHIIPHIISSWMSECWQETSPNYANKPQRTPSRTPGEEGRSRLHFGNKLFFFFFKQVCL